MYQYQYSTDDTDGEEIRTNLVFGTENKLQIFSVRSFLHEKMELKFVGKAALLRLL